MKRKKSLSVIARNEPLLTEIKSIKIDHPLWGYRRIWSYMKYRQGITVNKKRVYRLMKEQSLMVTPDVRLKAKRGPMRPKPHAKTNCTLPINAIHKEQILKTKLQIPIIIVWFLVKYSLSKSHPLCFDVREII